MSKLSQSILEKIRKEHREPLPHWRFVAMRVLIWLVVIVAIIIASVSLGTQLAQLINAEWGIATRWPGGNFGFLRETISWLWIGGIILSLLGAVIFFRHTKRGYRYSFVFISFVLITTSATAGTLLLSTSFPQKFKTIHDQYLPPKINVMNFHTPGEGRLVGEIISEEDDTIFLEAIDKHIWELWVFQEYAVLPADLVQVFGEVIDPSTFAVLSIQEIPAHYFVQGFPKDERSTR
jgi:Zn-dependent protease with chaperone function